MFENLSDKLEKAFKVLKGKGSISEINVAQTMKEIRKALLAADVDFKTAKEFTNKVKQQALGQEVLTALEPGQLLTKIMKDELANLMGSTHSEINLGEILL
jgi:signal recognition particle subunit SRP54